MKYLVFVLLSLLYFVVIGAMTNYRAFAQINADHGNHLFEAHPGCDKHNSDCLTETPCQFHCESEIPVPTPTGCLHCEIPTSSPTSTVTPAPGGGDGGGAGGVGGVSVSSCNDTKPASVGLISVTKTDPKTVLVKWNKVASVNSYNIQYGPSSHNYTFGVSQTGDADSFRISSLDPNANYCFVVRSINGCQLSDLSNEICTGTGQVLGVSAKRGRVLGVSTLAPAGNFNQTVDLIFQILGVISIASGTFFSFQKKIN